MVHPHILPGIRCETYSSKDLFFGALGVPGGPLATPNWWTWNELFWKEKYTRWTHVFTSSVQSIVNINVGSAHSSRWEVAKMNSNRFWRSILIHIMARANLNKSVWRVTNTTTVSKYIPRRTRISINLNPPFQTQIYLVKVSLNVNIVKQDILQKNSFWKFYEVRSERGDFKWCWF